VDYIKIALPKGRLTSKAFDLLRKINIRFDDYDTESRKLIFQNDIERIKVVSVKATDVPIYVEQGAADMGIAGKDVLLEADASVFELMDLGFGKCRFVVASLKDNITDKNKKLRVATKYPNVAKKYFHEKGMPIEIIKLNGSVELAPIIGLSDVIVDIVETGTTLIENGLVVIDEICPISSRLIINRASLKTKSEQIDKIVKGIQRNI